MCEASLMYNTVRYMNKLRTDGHLSDLRGIPFAQATNRPERFLMMSYNHLTAAIYGAFTEWPDNLLIRKAVHDGILNCTVFKRNMPQDALEYFISVHNSCHDNGGHSWLQQLEDAVDHNKLWNAHAEAHNISASLYGYSGPNSMPAQE